MLEPYRKYFTDMYVNILPVNRKNREITLLTFTKNLFAFEIIINDFRWPYAVVKCLKGVQNKLVQVSKNKYKLTSEKVCPQSFEQTTSKAEHKAKQNFYSFIILLNMS